MRHTRSQTGQRRSHHALVGVRVTLCESCASPRMNHRACPNCGKYNKREALNVYKKLDKKTKKTKEKVAKK
jgi:large subunit ribosomal protein L32